MARRLLEMHKFAPLTCSTESPNCDATYVHIHTCTSARVCVRSRRAHVTRVICYQTLLNGCARAGSNLRSVVELKRYHFAKLPVFLTNTHGRSFEFRAGERAKRANENGDRGRAARSEIKSKVQLSRYPPWRVSRRKRRKKRRREGKKREELGSFLGGLSLSFSLSRGTHKRVL